MADQPPASGPVCPHLIAFLTDRDVPCPACNYNLRGLTSDRCPECNRALVMQIRLAEPRLGAWVATLAAAAAMLGFNGLLAIYFLVWVMRRSYGPGWTMAVPLFISTPTAAAALIVIIRGRRRFCNLGDSTRLTLALAAWGLTALSAIAFFSRTD
ncbi:MAG TPA: hypothetical protein VEB22_11880 [Phycisphaerales bacterium]|nr:hypothetical protein [Phycisphaerales bacterium]